jgi:hypothetical protein
MALRAGWAEIPARGSILRIVVEHPSHLGCMEWVCIAVPGIFVPTERSRGSQLIRFQISPVDTLSVRLDRISQKSVLKGWYSL